MAGCSTGRATAYGWDEHDRLVSVTLPSGRRWTFDRDEHGNVVRGTDPAGGVTRYGYDAEHPGDLLTVIRKARLEERHKGGQSWSKNATGDQCLYTWLAMPPAEPDAGVATIPACAQAR